jgi:hypothetical protein
MRTLFENIRDRIKEIALFDVRFQLYKDGVSVRLMQMVLSSCDVHLIPNFREDTLYQSQVTEYNNFVFLKAYWRGEQVTSLLVDMENGCPIKIGSFSSVIWNSTLKELQFDEQRVSSGQRYSLLRRPFPFDLYEFPTDVENSSEFNAFHHMYANGVPFFPTLEDAEAYFLFDTFVEGLTNPSRRLIQIVLDDKRALFDRIVVTKLGLNIHLCGSELSKCEIKLFGRRPGLVTVVPVSGRSKVEIPLDTLPAELNVFLSIGCKILDQRFISATPSKYAPTEGVSLEHDEQSSIEGILNLRGENQYTEFKSDYSEKVLETVCAFGNADGGSIFIGMSNEAEVLGVENWDQIRLQVENGVYDRLNGHVIINYIAHLVPATDGYEKTVLEVRVEEAGLKPISLRIPGKVDRFYLRRDGTNRLMKRDDFVYLMQNHFERNLKESTSSDLLKTFPRLT